MNIDKLSSLYIAKELNDNNIEEILKLYLSNPEYFEYCPPKPSKEVVINDLRDLPPNMTHEDKHFIGYYDKNRLMGVLELITNYPDKKTCFIGLFMLDSEYHNRGIGSKMVEELSLYIREEGYKRIRLAYVVGNDKAKNFWERNGFISFEQRKALNSDLDVIVGIKELE